MDSFAGSMQVRMVPLALAILMAVSWLPGAIAAPTADEFWIDVAAEGAPEYDGATGLAQYEGRTDDRISWRLNLRSDYTIAEITLRRAFSISDPHQMVPWLDLSERAGSRHADPKIVPEILGRDVTPAEAPDAAANVTGDERKAVIRVGIPGAGPARLWLQLDKEAPKVELQEPIAVGPDRFTVQALSNELAWGTLHVREGFRGDERTFGPFGPAKSLKLEATGLDANTTYQYWATFRDWGLNDMESSKHEVRTTEAVVVPPPVVQIGTPAPGARILGEDVTLRASYTSAVPLVRVDILFDDEAVTGAPSWDASSIRYHLGGVNAGVHTVQISVEDEAGGTHSQAWSFRVVEPTGEVSTPTVPVAGLVVGLLLVGFVRGRQPPR